MPVTLSATALIGLLTLFGVNIVVEPTPPEAAYIISASEQVLTTGDTFTATLKVKSDVPVNVFAGEIHFNPAVLMVEAIDYNTSIADLWAETPWYSNGDGTVTFGGGTTRAHGFSGEDTLLTVTFTAQQLGESPVTLQRARILLHDGLGTDAAVTTPSDTSFFVTTNDAQPSIVDLSQSQTKVRIAPSTPSTDLNNDGEQTLADLSIFMQNIARYEPTHDFNLDGKTNLEDLTILLNQ